MRKLLLISLFAIFLSVSLVAADFSLSSDGGTVDICKGSTSVILTEVSGSGSFTVSTGGEASSFTTTVPTSFDVDGSKKIYSYVNPSSGLEKGEYTLDVEVDDGSEKKTESYTVNVKDCHETTLSVISDKQICACEETYYSLTIENLGEFGETFELSIEGTAKDWTTFSPEEATIAAGESETVKATISPPCSVHGEYELAFKAKAKNSLASAESKANLEIASCYDYSLELPKESYDLCEGVGANVLLTIKNNGKIKNTFDIIIDGPEWISSEKSVEVGAGMNESIILIANPVSGSEGDYTLLAEVVPKDGGSKTGTTIALSVAKCHEMRLDLGKEFVSICGVGKDHTYPVKILNKGSVPDVSYLVLEGPSWAELEESEVSLDSEEEKEISLVLSIPGDIEKGEYGVKVRLTSANGAKSEALLGIKITGEEDCYGAEITSEKDFLAAESEKGKTFTLKLKNIGLEDSVFKLSLSGDAKEFSLLNPESVDLAPEAEEELYLFVSPQLFVEDGEYNLTVSAKVKGTDNSYSKDFTIVVGEEVKGTEDEEKEGNFITRFFSKIFSFFKSPFSDTNETISEDINATKEVNKTSAIVEGVAEEVQVADEEEAPVDEEPVEVVNETVAVNETVIEEVKEDSEGFEIIVNTSEGSNESIKIDVDALLNLNKGEEDTKFNFGEYKWYLGGALIIIAIIIALASGLIKKVVEFFEEE